MGGALGRRSSSRSTRWPSRSTDTDVAVVTDGRTVLRRAPTDDRRGDDAGRRAHRPAPAAVHPLRRDLGDRPSRTAGSGSGCSTGGSERRGGRSAAGKGGEITAFKISPDGARMALVRKTADGLRARAGQDHPGGQDHRRRLADRSNSPRASSPRSPRSPTSPGSTPASCCCSARRARMRRRSPGPGHRRRLADHRRGGQPDDWDAREVTVLMRDPDGDRGRRRGGRPGGTTAASGCPSWTTSTPSRTPADDLSVHRSRAAVDRTARSVARLGR